MGLEITADGLVCNRCGAPDWTREHVCPTPELTRAVWCGRRGGMTVAELIVALQALPQDLDVEVYEVGFGGPDDHREVTSASDVTSAILNNGVHLEIY